MQTQVIDSLTYYLPASVAEVLDLVTRALAQNATVALRGSGHSFPLVAELETALSSGRPCWHVMLSKLAAVAFDAATGQVTVQAGCHLGRDPYDPTGISTEANSLCYQLDQLGWALPDLGGITHQTVGGFLATGSAGGSTKFSFDEQLLALSIVTAGAAGAELVTFRRPAEDNPNDPFFAAGVSLGLFGVIVSATFQCVPRFAVYGTETTSLVASCAIDLFGNGVPGVPALPSLAQYFRQTDYARLMWWPQSGVEKMVVWEAHQQPVPVDFTPQPYEEVPWLKMPWDKEKNPAVFEFLANMVFSGIHDVPLWLKAVLPAATYEQLMQAAGKDVLPALLNTFVTVNTSDNPPQQFHDLWHYGIPMDNQMDDRKMPVWFTELWIPLDEAAAVMQALHAHYQQGLAATGTFSCEIYAGKASRFWLSPAFGTDVVRIDVFWFARNDNSGRPDETFYPQFWALLAPFGFRPHWGKFLPRPDSAQGVKYLQARYAKFSAWLHLRAQLDPQQVFVSPYWRRHLGIADRDCPANALAAGAELMARLPV